MKNQLSIATRAIQDDFDRMLLPYKRSHTPQQKPSSLTWLERGLELAVVVLTKGVKIILQ